MITTSTVFVIGAGVSKSYGFPLGGDLIDAIIRPEGLGQTTTQRLFRTLLARAVKIDNYSKEYVDRFISTLQSSGTYSIDAWLRTNPSFIDIGKCAIAAIISNAESEAIDMRPNQEDDWFRWIWNRMLEDTNSVTDLLRNNISFITFNYDGMLEYCLQKYIQSSFSEAKPEKINEVLASLSKNIIHVHGALRIQNMPFDESFGAVFLHDSESNGVKRGIIEASTWAHRLSKSLHIISENISQHDSFAAARELIMESDRLVFLGLGYDKVNLQRLGIHEKVSSLDIPIYENYQDYPIMGTPTA